MNIYTIFSATDIPSGFRPNGLCGRLSYISRGGTLLSEKLSPDIRGDMMIISANDIEEQIAPAIRDECRKRGYQSVFLDADENIVDKKQLEMVSKSLTKRNLSVFCPINISDACTSAIPVADISLSGGVLSEYLHLLKSRHSRLGLSFSRMSMQFDMPTTESEGKRISHSALAQIIDTYDAKVFYSPQMELKYCIYSPSHDECRFILFDDAYTISKKLRLAKSFGISDIFLAYRDFSDIMRDITP